MKVKQVAVRFSKALYKQCVAAARKEDISVGGLVRRAVMRYVCLNRPAIIQNGAPMLKTLEFKP